MARAIWKGAISFGLVHIPVGLVSATSAQGISFDWLDKRSMDPVGYKRYNKANGKEVSREDIVKGIEYEKGSYVLIDEQEIRDALPDTAQTIDIFSFVDAEDIPLPNIEKPYYLSPDKRGEKVYALLRETLVKTNKVALANVVIRTKQRLAALMPLESSLMLVMLRWPAEVRGLDYLELPDAVKKTKLTDKEMDMAIRLVEDMSGEWNPEEYRDTFEEQIMELVEQKASQGKIESVEKEQDSGETRRSADVTDLTELLKRSLGGKGKPAKSASKSSSAKDADKPAGKGAGGSTRVKKASRG